MKFAFSFILIFIATGLFSQNGHNWTQVYGNKSMLLSGSVIGGVEDLGAIYYNPGRLSQIDNKAFLLSADVYEYNSLKVEDAFGDNASVSKSSIGGVPSFAAGTFSIPFMKKHYFGWAILVRNNSDLSFGYQNEIEDDVIEGAPGKEYFGAELTIGNKAREQWAGVTWSYPFNDKLSIGVSNFLSLIDQSKGNDIQLYAYNYENDATAIYRDRRSFSYQHYSLLWKLGLSYKADNAVYGLTLKTPHIKLKGEGSYVNQLMFAGFEGVHENPNQMRSTSQSGLATNYHSPWAIGAGATFVVDMFKINLSAEYFSKVNKYALMTAAPYYGQSSGDTLKFKLVDELRDIVNAGVGIEMTFTDKISGYASFCTDLSSVTSNITSFIENESEASNSIITANYYHFGGGVVMKIKRSEITFGMNYTGGQQQIPRAFNFPSNGNDDVFDKTDTSTLKWQRIGFMFSFSLPFLKEVQQKVENKIGL